MSNNNCISKLKWGYEDLNVSQIFKNNRTFWVRGVQVTLQWLFDLSVLDFEIFTGAVRSGLIEFEALCDQSSGKFCSKTSGGRT